MSAVLALRDSELVTTAVTPSVDIQTDDANKLGVHCWTRDEYHRMAELGLFDDLRVELLDGRIWDMPPQLTPHAVSVGMTTRALDMAFGQKHCTRVQAPIVLGDGSEPEPDVAVVPGLPQDYIQDHPHPQQIRLLVEVSDSTLRKDRGPKAQAYARAGITDYWIVNLIDTRLEVYRDPTPEGTYQSIRLLGPDKTIAPLYAPENEISVADLLPLTSTS